MKIIRTIVVLLLGCGCVTTQDIKSDDPTSNVKLDEVYAGFVSYVTEVKEQHGKGELPQPDVSPPDKGNVFVSGFGWVKLTHLDWYLTLRPVELKRASGLIMFLVREKDLESGMKKPPTWFVKMEKKERKWCPQSGLHPTAGKAFASDPVPLVRKKKGKRPNK